MGEAGHCEEGHGPNRPGAEGHGGVRVMDQGAVQKAVKGRNQVRPEPSPRFRATLTAPPNPQSCLHFFTDLYCHCHDHHHHHGSHLMSAVDGTVAPPKI